MRILAIALILAATSGSAYAASAEETACKARQTAIAERLNAFKGESMTRRLIQADIERSERELLEGDAEECNEALEHADKLLNEG